MHRMSVRVALAHVDAFALKLPAQHPSAHEGVLQVRLIEPAHERQIGVACGLGQVVHRPPADAKQPGLVGVTGNSCSRSIIALRSAIPLW
jgi:hypothetical protein